MSGIESSIKFVISAVNGGRGLAGRAVSNPELVSRQFLGEKSARDSTHFVSNFISNNFIVDETGRDISVEVIAFCVPKTPFENYNSAVVLRSIKLARRIFSFSTIWLLRLMMSLVRGGLAFGQVAVVRFNSFGDYGINLLKFRLMLPILVLNYSFLPVLYGRCRVNITV